MKDGARWGALDAGNLMVMTVARVGMAVFKFRFGGLSDLHYLDVEVQRLARQGVIAIDLNIIVCGADYTNHHRCAIWS